MLVQMIKPAHIRAAEMSAVGAGLKFPSIEFDTHVSKFINGLRYVIPVVGEPQMEPTSSYSPRKYEVKHTGLVSARDATNPNICVKDIGEFEFYFNGSTIVAFELLIQTLQESIPAMKAAGIK